MAVRRLLKCLVLLSAFLVFERVFAQCPGGQTCEESYLFCSLDEMNGYSCNNPSTLRDPNRAGCGIYFPPGDYRTWWSFVSQGGNVSIKFSVGNCACNSSCNWGLVFAIWGNCNFTDEIKCQPGCIGTNQSITYQVNLEPCKTYFISTDACCDSICDFTITTSGGGSPSLSLSDINNIKSGIIEPVCVGFCDYKFFVTLPPNGCKPTYTWALDGNDLNINSNEIKLDFPDQGDFKLCVTATLGNPKSGAICSQEGPKCSIVKVRPIQDKIGKTRTFCFEMVNPSGYLWHSQRIFSSGTYREHFADINCCSYDSVIQFIVLNEPMPSDVFYITCEDKPYIDILGQKWFPCIDHSQINLPKSE